MSGVPNIKVRGIRTPIPKGYILGRASPGTGDVELISQAQLAGLGIATQNYVNQQAITALTGDVTATGGGSAAATIANSAVTTAKIDDAAVIYAKIQDVTASKLLGRGSAAGDGPPVEITIGSGLSLSGTTLTATGGGGGASAFTDLSDAPSAYTSQALKYVRVNSGETGLEFAAFPSIPADFTDLGDVPSAYTSQALKYVRVNSGETALEFAAFPSIPSALTDLSDFPSSYTGAGGYTVKVNAGATGLEFVAGGGGDFLSLSDTPSSYTSQALKYLRVNAAETAVEFATFPTISTTFLGLTDTPSSYSGQATKMAVVNSGETALEFVAQPNTLEIGLSVGGVIRVSQIVAYAMIPGGGWNLPSGLSGSYAYCLVPPVTTSNTVVFDIEKSSTLIGTVTFTNGSNTGVFSFTSDVAFSAGQSLNLRAPSDIDGMQDISIVFKGTV